jgi:RNA-directed DNA polymerase
VSTALRHAEYYNMQDTFDALYEKSKKNATKGLNLYDMIISKDNILLAYRNIKANTGSKTAGTDGITIDQYKIESVETFVEEIRTALKHYKPQTVQRIEIPKPNGKKRPLGIPTMRDRLIQQMFKQVLEPICEAKFYNHSYGFRPNRSAHHAMARCQHLVNRTNNHHVVDIDIQGFFDDVSHTKLIKQLYRIGICDKRVLTILSKMLKAPIKGIGIPVKGTPQGGILSPLLSNIVLNDLDWWISRQWGNLKTRFNYSRKDNRVKFLKGSNLKEMYIVRYADDFKVFTNSYKSAIKIYHAVKGYLKNQLNLDISTEKSTITNLRKRKSGFLGFSLKAVMKRKKYVANTHILDKKIENIQEKARSLIRRIQKCPTPKAAMDYNTYILGIKNYYKIATHVNIDFTQIAYRLSRALHNRLKSIGKYGIPVAPSVTYKRLHKNNFKTYAIAGIHLFPLADIQTKNSMNFSQDICNYTKEGRLNLHKKLKADISTEINKMLKASYEDNHTLEYRDNRISRYSMQQGKCAITGTFLASTEVHCHHKMPQNMGGTDEFSNLVIVHENVHRLIHATDEKTIVRYRSLLQLDGKQLKKLNQFRKVCNLAALV